MAAVSGKQGLFSYKGVPVFRLNSFDLDIAVDSLDVTSFSTGTVQWRDMIAGLSGWTGTASGFWDPTGSTAQKDMQTNVLTPATGTAKFELDKDVGGNFSGDVILSQSVSVGIEGTADVTFNVQGNGVLTYATTT